MIEFEIQEHETKAKPIPPDLSKRFWEIIQIAGELQTCKQNALHFTCQTCAENQGPKLHSCVVDVKHHGTTTTGLFRHVHHILKYNKICQASNTSYFHLLNKLLGNYCQLLTPKQVWLDPELRCLTLWFLRRLTSHVCVRLSIRAVRAIF